MAVATVTRKDVPVEIRTIGTVEAYSTVTLRSQVDGQLAEIHFQEGQEVKKGDLLFTIDARPFEATLREALARLAKDDAQASNAEVEADRRERLFAKGFVSRDEYDQARTQAVALRATAHADEATVESAKLKLQYCNIRSPLDGRIGRILVHAGNVVKENDTPLAVINQLRPAYVSFWVPEERLPEIRERSSRDPLEVSAKPANQPEVERGKLTFIDNAVDAATGTVLLKGVFDNRGERLWPGELVDVSLVVDVRKGAVVVPAAAVQTGQSGTYVFAVTSEGKADLRPVVVERTVGSDSVISQGVETGMRVVTDGQSQLAPHMAVAIRGEPSPSPPPAGSAP